jgi:hypothetical protein
MDNASLLKAIAVLVLGALSLYFLLGKSWFLARGRLGWLMMLANVPYETFCRGWRKRWHVDALAMVWLGAGWMVAAGVWAGAVWWLVFGAAWLYSLCVSVQWLSRAQTEQDARYDGKIPLPLPQLIVQLKGPVLDRGPVHELGAWPVGRQENFEFILLNPADRVHCQFPLEFEFAGGADAVEIANNPSGLHPGPDPGEVLRLPFSLRAARPCGRTTLTYRLRLGSYETSGALAIDTIFDPAGVRITEAKIDRWKGGARGAWCWRGDVDLYDPATWQSIEGLRPSLELARRYRVPHTMFVSARLTLDEAESAAHSKAFGLDRRSHEIPALIKWIRREVELKNVMDWPATSAKPYCCELANHYWLHYGTHSAAEPGNDWKIGALPGQGKYAWSQANGDSRQEQTDNARRCVETFQRLFQFTPTAWGIPGRGSDPFTPEAIEAAGMLISGDSDCQAFVNVFRQPAPHHPRGTKRMVELSKKYPGDPLVGDQLALLKYWTWHARPIIICGAINRRRVSA